MKKKLLTGLLIIAGAFVILVLARFAVLELSSDYGSHVSAGGFARQSRAAQEASKRNYASVVFTPHQTAAAIEQKYEKVGDLSNLSSDFSADERKARTAVVAQHGIIQEEQNTIGRGARVLQLTIGVPPDTFDNSVEVLKQVGRNQHAEITKTDKTNEFLDLRAKRGSLEKTRDALLALKSQGGKLEELIVLEKEVLLLENQIQALGVTLGQFDKENQFCTVRFALVEDISGPSRNHLGNLLTAIEWASQAYLVILGIALLGLLCIVLALVGLEKAKLLVPENRG